MKSENELPVFGLAAVMAFVRRPDEIILRRCTDGTVLIDRRTDPAEVVGRVLRPVIRTMLARSWIAPNGRVFAITAQGRAAALWHFVDFHHDDDFSKPAAPRVRKASRHHTSTRSQADDHPLPKGASPAKPRRSAPTQTNAVAGPSQSPPASRSAACSSGRPVVCAETDDEFINLCNQLQDLYPNGIPYETMPAKEREMTRRHRENVLRRLIEKCSIADEYVGMVADSFACAAWHLRTNQPAAPTQPILRFDENTLISLT